MQPIRVNGVVVHCGHCVHFKVSPEDEPCKACWAAIYHTGNIKDVNFEDIEFYPSPDFKEHFLELEKMVRKYRSQFSAIETDVKEHGVSIAELCEQINAHTKFDVWVGGIR